MKEIEMKKGYVAQIVKVTPKVMSSLGSIPRDVQAEVRRAVEWLKTNNESLLKPQPISKKQSLFRSPLRKGYWLVYSKQKSTTTVIDITRE